MVSGLSKAFGPVRAVDDLSFEVEPGVITGFLGPNGSGKTTTLRMLLGLISPDSGSATIGGRGYSARTRPNSDIGAVLDAAGFHPARTGRNHLRVYCTVNGYPPSRADEVLALVGLAESGKRAVRGYSLGMRQRLALATALLGDPAVLVLDEPANGLDPEGIVWMRELLRHLADEGRTVLVSSHVLSEVQQLVDHVVIINRGRLVQQSTLVALAEASSRVAVRTPDVEQLRAALDRAGAHVEQSKPDSLQVTGLTVAEVGHHAFAAGVELHGLAAEHGELERMFFALTADTEQQPETMSGRVR